MSPGRRPGRPGAMTDHSPQQARTVTGEPVPDPGSGEVGGAPEPMTEPQQVHLRALCAEAGEDFDETLTGAEAAERIGELERRLPGRGQD